MEILRVGNSPTPGSLWQESEWGQFRQLNLWLNSSVTESEFIKDSGQNMTNQNSVKELPEQIEPEESLSTFKVKRRERGDGSGQIRCHYANRRLKKQIKSYKQYWYHYELWSDGERLVKGSVYIPKAKLVMVQKMESLKLSVLVILEALGKKV